MLLGGRVSGAQKTILKVSLNSDLTENASLFDAEALVSALFLNLHTQGVQVLICRTLQSPLPNNMRVLCLPQSIYI